MESFSSDNYDIQLGKVNCYFRNIGHCFNFVSSNQSNFTACISQVWPLNSISRQFGSEILHEYCFTPCRPSVMVWLMILRDMFSSSYYYLIWIRIDFFCAYSYVVGHLVASSVWERWLALVSSLSVRTWLIGLLKTFLLSSIIQITTEVFLPT